MKIEYKGKNQVMLTITKGQLNTLLAALDSACEAIAHMESSGYKDVPKFYDALIGARALAQMARKGDE